MIEPESPVEEALAVAAERVVAAVAAPQPREITFKFEKFNLFELLALYDFGMSRLPKSDLQRWRATFSLAAGMGWLWVAREQERNVFLGVVWRTKNPHVNLSREIPQPDPEGNYCYIGWCWNLSGARVMPHFIKHCFSSWQGIEFLACHDQRAKLRKKRRGKLWVMAAPERISRVTTERNGHG